MIEFDIKLDTVLQHLLKYIQCGNSLPPEPLRELSSLSPQEQERVLSAFDRLGFEQLSPVYHYFEEEFSYLELRILQIWLYARAARDSSAS